MSDELYLHAIIRYQDLDTGEIVETHDRFGEQNLRRADINEVLSSSDPVGTYLRVIEPDLNVWYDEDEHWNPYIEHKKYLFEWLKKHEKRKIVWEMI